MAVLLCLVSFMLNVVVYGECRKQTHDAECHYAECCYAECHYAECCYVECHYAECHYAECRGAQEITQNLFGSCFQLFLSH
jgi:hypothetical protein